MILILSIFIIFTLYLICLLQVCKDLVFYIKCISTLQPSCLDLLFISILGQFFFTVRGKEQNFISFSHEYPVIQHCLLQIFLFLVKIFLFTEKYFISSIEFPWYLCQKGHPVCSAGKEPTCQWRRHKRHDSIPGSGRSLGAGNGKPLQYYCLEIRIRVRHEYPQSFCQKLIYCIDTGLFLNSLFFFTYLYVFLSKPHYSDYYSFRVSFEMEMCFLKKRWPRCSTKYACLSIFQNQLLNFFKTIICYFD